MLPTYLPVPGRTAAGLTTGMQKSVLAFAWCKVDRDPLRKLPIQDLPLQDVRIFPYFVCSIEAREAECQPIDVSVQRTYLELAIENLGCFCIWIISSSSTD
jgi:hypothetical protein